METQDPVDSDTKDLRVWLVKVRPGGAKELRDGVVGAAKKAKIEVLVLRSDMVFGSDHLRSALYHAKRAIREGRNASDSLSMETLLYASGERQLNTAIKKVAVDDGCEEVVIAQLTPGSIDIGASWAPMPGIKARHETDDLIKFGVTLEELANIDPERALDLVLERVAAVDVLKK